MGGPGRASCLETRAVTLLINTLIGEDTTGLPGPYLCVGLPDLWASFHPDTRI